MNTVRSSSQPFSVRLLLNFLGISLLASTGVSVMLMGIVLLISSAN